MLLPGLSLMTGSTLQLMHETCIDATVVQQKACIQIALSNKIEQRSSRGELVDYASPPADVCLWPDRDTGARQASEPDVMAGPQLRPCRVVRYPCWQTIWFQIRCTWEKAKQSRNTHVCDRQCSQRVQAQTPSIHGSLLISCIVRA